MSTKVAELYAELSLQLDESKVKSAEAAVKAIAKQLQRAEINAEKLKIQTAQGVIQPVVKQEFNAAAEAAKRFAKEVQRSEITKELDKLRTPKAPVVKQEFNAAAEAAKRFAKELQRSEITKELDKLRAPKTPGEHPVIKTLRGIPAMAKSAGLSIAKWIGGALQHAAGNLISSTIRSAFSELKDSVKETINAGSQLEDLRQKTGLSGKFLQELAFSAGDSVGKLDDVGRATTRFGINLSEAVKKKKGPFVDAMREIGLSVSDLQTTKPEALISKIGVAFSKMSDGTQKQGIAAAAFGARLGPDMIQPLNELSEKTKLFNKIGGGIGEGQISQLDNVGDGLQALGDTWKQLKMRVAAGLAPALQELIDKTQAWASANGTSIQEFITDAILKVGKVAGKVFSFFSRNWSTISSVLSTVGTAIAFVAGHFGALIKIFAGIKIAAALAWVATLGPIGLIIAAIAAVAALIYTFREEIAAAFTAVGGFFADIGRGIKQVFTDVFAYIADKLNWVASIPSKIKSSLGGLGRKIFGGGEEAMNFNTLATSVYSAPQLPTSQVPTQGVGAGGTRQSITVNNVINADGLTQAQAAALVDQKMSSTWRDAAANLGGR